MPKVKESAVTSRLGKCMMCKESEAKYRCPECDLVSCSLPCINKHKREFECSGIRSKTDFVPVKKMNEFHLLSDYRLLEEVSRVSDACSRDVTRKVSRQGPLPMHLQKIRKAVSNRQSRIYFLPKTFRRHKDNTTNFDWKSRLISWKLSVTFLHAQKFSITVAKCPEDTFLEVIIGKCLTAAINRKKEFRKHFEAYQHAKSDIEVLLQAEKIREAQKKFYILDNKKSLKENLVGKRIVEFPMLYIALKGFYRADNVEDVVEDSTKKSKLDSLLISNYSLNEDKEILLSSESELGDEDTTKQDDVGKSDSDDSLDDDGTYKDVLSSLYKQAMENS